MSDQPEQKNQKLGSQLLKGLVPDLLLSVVAPLLIYHLISPHMSASQALLLSGLVPIVRVGIDLLRKHRLNPLGALSVLSIALKIIVTLIFNNAQLTLISDSFIIGVHGILMLGSLFASKPLLLWLLENTLQKHAANQPQIGNLLNEAPRSSWMVITAIWGCTFLLECVINSMLVFSLPVESFLGVSAIVRYGLLGVAFLVTFLFGWIRRRLRQKGSETFSGQVSQGAIRPPVPR